MKITEAHCLLTIFNAGLSPQKKLVMKISICAVKTNANGSSLRERQAKLSCSMYFWQQPAGQSIPTQLWKNRIKVLCENVGVTAEEKEGKRY